MITPPNYTRSQCEPTIEDKSKFITSKKRNQFFDLLKTWAIYLVILQHMIAACGIGLDMMNHPVGKTICMFNMPLFMMITGFFSLSSISRPFHVFFKNKYDTWLRPALIFSLLLTTLRLSFGILPFPTFFKLAAFYFIFDFLSCYWFIPVAFLCCLIAKIFYNNNLIFLLISWLIVTFFPIANGWPILAYLKAMYPFFIIGLVARHFNLIEKIKKHPVLTGLPSLILFISLWPWFNRSRFFYSFTIQSISDMTFSYIAMLLAGSAGIVLSILFIYYLNSLTFKGKAWLVQVGSYTFIIYMIQQIVVQIIEIINPCIYNLGIILTISVIVLILCVFCAKIFEKNKTTRLLLLGKE